MKHTQHATDAELAYIVQDAQEAIAAYPLSPNTERYLAEARACQEELARRSCLRTRRRAASLLCLDPLAYRATCRPGAVKYRLRPHRFAGDEQQLMGLLWSMYCVPS